MNNILHIDCDAFYASCEELRNPRLKNFPLAVGGLSNKSIITTANYKAREYGIHSAMPVFMAKELCPDLILLKVDHPYYREKSKEVFDIIRDYAINFEQVSIDEAYLQVTSKDPYKLAATIQNEVFDKTKINVSIGISYNKFLAKLASDWNKPHGIKEISKDDLPDILLDLDIKKVHGLGSHGVAKLRKIGIYTIRDLMKLDQEFLIGLFGKHGTYIYNVIRGIDDREINPTRQRKSLGRERTFANNTNDINILNDYLLEISEKIESDLASKDLQGKTVNLKLKNADFKTITRAITLQEPVYKKEEIYRAATDLLKDSYKNEYIRLIGISISKLSDRNSNQLSFL
ncbi:DNA polymerase IV [Anaerococcus sp. Marseille-Q7828]|uniref:DNA polymerase IV n=1 Tax=Anaerococcus sp. Marseille-Q7828 TaxID=3036300 RepID=UPI0024AD8C2C|nr:DNA polymerase IV [Anaerococcus sp. Marseille-Q7828]